MQSPSATARDVAAQLFDDRRGLKKRFEDVGFDPSAETLMKGWNEGLTRALRGTKDGFTEHWKAAGALGEREFNEAVGRALRNGGEADDPRVARAAKLWRSDVFGPMSEAAIKAGLLHDGVEPQAAAASFSRIWSRGKLFAMEREFKSAVADYLSREMAREARQGGTTGTGFDAKAREITDDLFDTLTGRAETGPRPELEKVRIQGQDRSLHIPDALAAPFLEDDIERVGRRFVRTLGADLELARKFGTPDMAQALHDVRAEYDRRRAGVADETEIAALNEAEKRDVADLAALRDRVRGTCIESTVERNYARIVRAADHLEAVHATGEVVLASLPDAVRPAMVEGLSAYMKTVDRLTADLKVVNISASEAALAAQVAERVLAHRLSSLADIDDPYASRTPADEFLHKMTDLGSPANGVRIFADMEKSFAAVMVQDRILKAVREFATLDVAARTYLDAVEIDERAAARIAGQFAKHGEEIDGVCVAHTMAWDKDDATVAALRGYRSAVNKDMASLAKSDAVGSLFGATPTGEAIRALKNFALASWQRLLLRGLDEKASRFMGGLVAMTAMGMFAAWMRSRSRNRTDELDAFAADASSFIGEGFERAGIMSVPLELSDAFEKATGFNPLGPLQGMEANARLLPFNAYPGIRQMLGYALHPHN